MALSPTSILSQIKALLPSFNFTNSHNRSVISFDAIAKGVVDVITRDALVVVSSHAGSEYPITGVSASAIEDAIKGYMDGFVFTGVHSDAITQPRAVAEAVASVMSSKAKVAVPYDGVGVYPILYVAAGDIESAMIARYSADEFVLGEGHCRSGDVINAVATSIADAVSLTAKSTINGYTGGSFLIY